MNWACGFSTPPRAMAAGIRIYRQTYCGVDDTREVSHEMHSSEKIIGRWLRSRGVRRDVILVTKAWENYTTDHLMEAIRGSLERLQTDFVDVYLFHRYFAGTPIEQAVAAMDAVVTSGLARAGGASNFNFDSSPARCKSAGAGAQAVPGDREQLQSGGARPGARDPSAGRREQIGVLTYSPLGAGFLMGKYTPDRSAFPKGTRFDVVPGHADVYFSDRNFPRR